MLGRGRRGRPGEDPRRQGVLGFAPPPPAGTASGGPCINAPGLGVEDTETEMREENKGGCSREAREGSEEGGGTIRWAQPGAPLRRARGARSRPQARGAPAAGSQPTPPRRTLLTLPPARQDAAGPPGPLRAGAAARLRLARAPVREHTGRAGPPGTPGAVGAPAGPPQAGTAGPRA